MITEPFLTISGLGVIALMFIGVPLMVQNEDKRMRLLGILTLAACIVLGAIVFQDVYLEPF